MSRQRLLRFDRVLGIGGTDLAAIFGLSPWKSLPQLWLEKTRRLPEGETADSEMLEWGRYLEGPIARKYAERTGRELRGAGSIRHPLYPHLLGNPDRFQRDRLRPKGEQRGILEIKTAMFGKLREWSRAGIPAQYYLQLQHYLAITGLSWGSFAILFGGNKLVYFDVPRDEKLIPLMIEKANAFWRYVVDKRFPPFELSAEWNSELAAFFPKPTQAGPLVLNTPEAIGKARLLLRLKEAEKTNTERINELEAWFKLQLADHARGLVPGLASIRWEPSIQRRVNLKRLRELDPVVALAHTDSVPTRRFYFKGFDEAEGEEAPETAEAPLVMTARQIEID